MDGEANWFDLMARRLAGRRGFLQNAGRGIIGSLAAALAGSWGQAKAAAPRYRIRKATAAEKSGLATRARAKADYSALRTFATAKGFVAQAPTAFVILDLEKIKGSIWQERYVPAGPGGPALAFAAVLINYFEIKFGATTATRAVSSVDKANGTPIFVQYPKNGKLTQT